MLSFNGGGWGGEGGRGGKYICRANDFPFSPETEAEFGGLKQNFQ